jgi:pimeloyl-ACP methyl ester carboxylesterase
METNKQYADEALVASLEGFSNRYADVNGITLHYVEGGAGIPLILLSGWPQTWYSFHRIMPQLVKKYRVIALDYRGMGGSSKPEDGYDKKTIARDIYELINYLGYEKVFIAGHDIGAMVAYSFAANYPEVVAKLILMDASHPSEMMLKMPMIPVKGAFPPKMNPQMPYGFWMAFNQVKGLPEQLLEGRFHLLQDWLYEYVMIDAGKMEPFERQVYAQAYNDADSIRASNGWYQTFAQDIEDSTGYGSFEMPVLGIGGNIGGKTLKMSLPRVASNAQVVELADCGHFVLEEQPEKVLEHILNFLG